MSQDQNLTAQGGTIGFTLKPGQSASYSAGGTFTGFAILQRSRDGGMTWATVTTGAADTAISGTVKNETTSGEAYRGYLADTDALTVATGTLEVSFTDAADVLWKLTAPDGTDVLVVTDDGISFVGDVSIADDLTVLGDTTPSGAPLSGDTRIYFTAGAPVDYTDGSPAATGEGLAGIGSLCVDTTNGKLYINGGTKAQPVWKLVTSAV